MLRRAKDYEVRRYPAHISAVTTYDKRPEGYDRLGSYVTGSNTKGNKLTYFSPTIMEVSDESNRRKEMRWPLSYALPGRPLPQIESFSEPTIPKVGLAETPGKVVAVRRFETAATEVVAKGYSGLLLKSILNDGLKPITGGGKDLITVAQFDALFSLNKRRIEVWIELEDHPWKSKGA